MSYKPMTGIDPTKPILVPDGTGPVCMSNPAYSQWTVENVTTDPNATTSCGGAAYVVLTVNDGTPQQFVGGLELKMLATGLTTINATLTQSTSGAATANISFGGVFAGSIALDNYGGATSGQLTVPYYRYRIVISLILTGSAVATGDWMRVDLSLT